MFGIFQAILTSILCIDNSKNTKNAIKSFLLVDKD